ncbi:MAG: M50 family metallopeptidase [bacterium]
MFGKRITLFRLLGFEVRIDVSWLIIAFLITWSLAKGFFPGQYEGLPELTYWWMGVAGALGLFLSIIFHELSHSLVARRFGIHMKGITLFVFGGVAEMDEEPPSAKAEFFMAIAGPAASILIAGFFFLLVVLTYGYSVVLTGVIWYLAVINLVLAGFNLLPAYPLDGGRVLRSILWQWKGNLRWSTRIASQMGSLFGLFMIFFGILNVLTGAVIGGVWWFIIGLFLRNASQMSYQQVVMRKALEGEKVRRFMKKDPVTIPSSITIRELVEDYIYKYHFKMFPVVDNGNLVGCITTKQIKEVPAEQWATRRVGELLSGCSRINTISPDIDAVRALSSMSQSGNSRLMVVEGDKLVGIITLKDIMGFLSVKLDLGEKEA